MAYDLYGNYIPDGDGGFLRRLFRGNQPNNQNLGSMAGYTAGDYSMYGAGSTPTTPYSSPSMGVSYFPGTGPKLGAFDQAMQNQLRQSYAYNPPATFSAGTEQKMADFLNRNTPPPDGGGAADVAKSALGLAGATNPYIAGATLALGGLSTIGGLIRLATTKEPEGYKLTPKLQRSITEAEQRAQFGLGAPQIALQRQMAREALNTQLMNTRNLSGGSLSRAALGSNVYASLLAGNQLAAQDFAAMETKRKYRDAMYGQEQDIANREVARNLQQYAQEQISSGGAMQQGLTNLGSYFNLQAALANKQTA